MLLPHTLGSVTNVHGADTVSVGAVSAVWAEVSSGVRLMPCSAYRAGLAGVFRVNVLDLNTCHVSLVFDERCKTIETPGVQGRVVFTACSCRDSRYTSTIEISKTFESLLTVFQETLDLISPALPPDSSVFDSQKLFKIYPFDLEIFAMIEFEKIYPPNEEFFSLCSDSVNLGFSVPTHYSNDLTQDRTTIAIDGLVLRAGVLGIQPNVAIYHAIGLDGSLIVEQSHNNVVVPYGILLMYDNQVIRENAGLQHGLTTHTQSKVLSGETVGVEGEVFFDTLFSQNGIPRRNGAHQRNLVLPGNKVLCNGNGSGPSFGAGNQAFLLKCFHVEMDGRGGFEIDSFGNFTHGRGVPMIVSELQNEIINFLLFGSKILHIVLLSVIGLCF